MKYIVIILALIIPVSAQAQIKSPEWAKEERAPDIPEGEDRMQYLEMGQEAPFEGMLLDMDTSLRWTNKLRWYHMRLRLVHQERGSIISAIEDSWKTRLRIVEESYKREIKGLRKDIRSQAEAYEEDIERLEERPWYTTWGFGATVGIIITSAVALIGAFGF